MRRVVLLGCLLAVQGEPIPPPIDRGPVAPAEMFVGALRFQGKVLGVMGSTYVTLDGRPTPYWDVPDEGTELAEIGLDLRRNTVTRLIYLKRKDF